MKHADGQSDSPAPNPYAAPTTVTEVPRSVLERARPRSLRVLIAIQAGVIAVGLVVESYQHESIVGSGPIFAALGLAILIVGAKFRDRSAMLFGGSAIAFATLIVFLINYYSWGPPQGDKPITIMSLVYASVALPFSAWIAFAKP